MNIFIFLKEKSYLPKEDPNMDVYLALMYILAYIGLFATAFYILSMFSYYRQPQQKTNRIFSVSIIVPAFNEEQSIAHTLEALLKINYPRDKVEILVVDDGSTDKTYAIAKKFESRGVRIFHKPNGGKGSALNFGINHAK